MSEPQVTMTGPARLRALAADLELIRADMEAFDLRQLAALWEADLSYAAGLIADEILRAERAEAALDRATNDLMLSEESFVTMRAKRDEVLSELRTTRAALERARAVLEDWRSTTPYTGSFRRAADELATALEGDKP